MTNLLFICKYNRFRSKIAESLFNIINKKEQNKAKSAGIIKGSYPLDTQQVKVAKKRNILLTGHPQGLSTELLKWQDIAIIVADDVPASILKDNKKYGKKVIKWSIRDAKTNNAKEIEKIISKIEKKVIYLTEAIA